MKRLLSCLLTLCMIIACVPALDAGLRVEWGSGVLTDGQVSVGVFGASEGQNVILALYGENGLESVKVAKASSDGTFLTVEASKVTDKSRAKVFVWSGDYITPEAAVLSTATPDGIVDGSAYNGPALGSVGGTVKAADGTALENVEITLTADGFEARTTKTGPDGGYGFTDVPVGEYTVTATAPEDMEGETSASVTVTEDKTATADFTFKPVIHYGSVGGTVKAADGTALENVEVTLTADGFEARTTKTGPDGGYGFTDVPVGEYTVTATAPEDMEGETSASVTVTEDKTATADFTFKPVIHYGSVGGTVKAADGTALENVEVALTADGFEARTTKTGPDGGYGFTDVPVGEYTVTATAPEDMEGDTSAAVTVVDGKTATADFVLSRIIHFGSVSGTVKTDDGEPVANLDVMLTAGDFETRTAKTGADGSFNFDNVPIGEYAVIASVDDSMEGETAKTVAVSDGKTSTVEFIFSSAGPEIEKWYSDDQIQNHSASVAYHSFDPLEGEYEISFELTVKEKGDNAIMLHDSSNTPMNYEHSSVILLFDGDNFAVKSGNGGGSYTTEAINLCPVVENEVYKVTIAGNVDDNSYTVSITNGGGETHTSALMKARTNASKLNSIALINNSHKTVVSGGHYSDYRFYITGFSVESIVEDPVYNGFAGRYFGVKAGGKYIRGNNGKLSADLDSVKDESAMFLPRYMGDGSYSFVCRSSDRRITATQAGQLISGDYDYNGDTQHWILEKSENYTDDKPAYYLKSLENNRYIGLSNGYLTSVTESQKTELVFEPLNEQSPLRLISETEAYAQLGRKQRQRIEMIYETVAGDVFDRYSNDIIGAKWTPRLRIDNIFKETKGDDDALYDRLVSFLDGDDRYLITDNDIANSYFVSAYLPGTEGVTYKLDGGEHGTYDFWKGTMLQGTKYKLTLYNAAGELEQTVDLYVQDDGNAKKNGETFPKAFVNVPYIYRKNITSVKIRSDTANSYNCGYSDLYIRVTWTPNQSQMLCTICHELSHSNSAGSGGWAEGSGWAQAIDDDMITVSPYGGTNPTEDFAEFGRLYFISCGNRDRQVALQLLFPNRYASYYRMRHSRLNGFELWEDTEYPEEY